MNWTIIYHYHDQPVHLDHLYKSNPNAQIIPLYIKNDYDPVMARKHGDRIIRHYLKNIFEIIYYDDILLLEWDNYITKEIPLFPFEAMFAKYVITNINNGWCWWEDLEKLPIEYRQYATGLPFWGFTGIKKVCLEELLKDKYDEIYELDVHTEIKSGTILRSLGYTLSQYPESWGQYLLNARREDIEYMDNYLQNNPNASGFFHPVKRPIILSEQP